MVVAVICFFMTDSWSLKFLNTGIKKVWKLLILLLELAENLKTFELKGHRICPYY